MPPQGFGYQKWFEYEVRMLIPYISNGPLISWLYLCLQGDRTIRRGGACRPQALGRVSTGPESDCKGGCFCDVRRDRASKLLSRAT